MKFSEGKTFGAIKPDLDSLEIVEDLVEQLTFGYFYLKDKDNAYILFAGKLIVVDGLKPKEFTYSYKEGRSSSNNAGCNYSLSEYFNNEINKKLIFNEREFEGLCRYIGREK